MMKDTLQILKNYKHISNTTISSLLLEVLVEIFVLFCKILQDK